MKRKIIVTEDGSKSLYMEDMQESYHSTHGAIQESMHVFIESGLYQLTGKTASILELGLGTGLNALLSLEVSRQKGLNLHYHSIERYPLNSDEYLQLNYHEFLDRTTKEELMKIHTCLPDQELRLDPGFTFFKEMVDFREMKAPGPFDLVFFDAFAPDKQPELWSTEIFSSIHKRCKPGALLLTYSSKGSARRAITNSGFRVEKIPGPPGKREMVRAIRI